MRRRGSGSADTCRSKHLAFPHVSACHQPWTHLLFGEIGRRDSSRLHFSTRPGPQELALSFKFRKIVTQYAIKLYSGPLVCWSIGSLAKAVLPYGAQSNLVRRVSWRDRETQPDERVDDDRGGWPGGVGQADGARGAYRSRLRNAFADVDPSGRGRAEGRVGAVWG